MDQSPTVEHFWQKTKKRSKEREVIEFDFERFKG